MKTNKKLIEATLPLDAINKPFARGKSTRPGDVLREFLKFANRVDLH